MSDLSWTHLLNGAEALLPLIVQHALSVLGALVILIVGYWLSGKAESLVDRAFESAPHFDPMLRSFFGSLARYSVLALTVLAVLAQFGVQTASVVAVLGAAGLAIGLALQGTLSHLAAGVMLLIFRPFRVGDKVQVGGMTGTVKTVTLFWTELTTDDNIQIIVPNAGIWGQPLRNYTVYGTGLQSGQAHFWIREGANAEELLRRVRSIVESHKGIAKTPAPTVLLDRTATENALEIVVGFSTAGDPALIKSDLIQSVEKELGAGARRKDAA